ncbi:protein-tyrosine phosphatase family protein [Hydrogenovibrio crunogenus]|nr:dual specificity protein phosphatase family protein [Hydrogenovibrio crunogenus]
MKTALYPICHLGNGTLSVMPKPRTEQLQQDIFSYKEQGVTHVISLLKPAEIEAFQMREEADICKSYQLSFTHFPIKDMDVPDVSALKELNLELKQQLSKGAHIAIHCHGGRGRAGTVAISLMIEHGYDATEAMKIASKARGDKMPVCDLQVEFIHSYH